MFGAASENREPVVKWLLEHHANVNAQSLSGRTPLMQAVWHGYPDIARLLLIYGADVNAQDTEGGTALYNVVCGSMDKNIIRILMAHGANPTLTDKKGVSSLSYAENRRRLNIVALLRKGAK